MVHNEIGLPLEPRAPRGRAPGAFQGWEHLDSRNPYGNAFSLVSVITAQY